MNDECINNRTLLVGPSFSSRTHLMLKILSRLTDEDVFRLNNSHPEQYSNSKIKIKAIDEAIVSPNEYENAIIVFDDMSGSSKSRYLDQFFIREKLYNLDIYYQSKSYIHLPKRSTRNKSNKMILFNQTAKHVENIYRDVTGYNMSRDDIKE